MRSLQTRRFASLSLVAALFAVLMPARDARADEITGTWTGEMALRGNYYWERSTRVTAPEIGARLEAPSGHRVSAVYLVDSITSASQAAGATVDVRFTETRHDLTLTTGREREVGIGLLDAVDLSGGVHFSREPDYHSISGNFGAAFFLNDRSTTINLRLGYLHDEVRRNYRGPPPPTSGTLLVAFNEDFDALTLSVGWDQVLTPLLVMELSYDFAYVTGFLANAYRRVMVAGAAVGEQHPEVRRRHTVSARLKYHVPRTRTTFQLHYRAYLDSWNLGALNPEVRIYQPFAEHFLLRFRYRYYRQRRSFFYEADQTAYTQQDPFVTADPKMSTFTEHELGMQLVFRFGFLDGTALEWLSGASLDMSFNYVWRDNAFGDAVIAQAGLRVPF